MNYYNFSWDKVDLLYLYYYGLNTLLDCYPNAGTVIWSRRNLNLAVHESEFLNQGMTKQANIHGIQEFTLQNSSSKLLNKCNLPVNKRAVPKSNNIPFRLGAEVLEFQLEGLWLGLAEPVWLLCWSLSRDSDAVAVPSLCLQGRFPVTVTENFHSLFAELTNIKKVIFLTFNSTSNNSSPIIIILDFCTDLS